MKVGNIVLNPGVIRKDSIEIVTKLILDKSLNEGKYDEMCQKYTGDNNHNRDCSLGWFFRV